MAAIRVIPMLRQETLHRPAVQREASCWRMEAISAPPMHSLTFHGSLAELQAVVATLGVPCHWEHKGPFELAVFDDPASNLKLNWWPATGVLELVGDPEVRVGMEQRLAEALAGPDAG